MSAHSNADALSRLPLSDTIDAIPVPAEMILTLQESPIIDEQIQSWISKDQVLNQIVQFIQQGWPNHCPGPTGPVKLSLQFLEGVLCGVTCPYSRARTPEAAP